MSLTITLPKPGTYAIHRNDGGLSQEEFWELCSKNPELVIEREADGQITVMSPVGFKTGERENIINAYLTIWAIENGLGTTASPSTGFVLPSGEVRSADASWISDERLEGVETEDLDRFPELVPDFIVEIRSKSDNLKPLQRKMQDTWMASGVRLSWLFDIQGDQVFIYREGGSVEVLPGLTAILDGGEILTGFSFDVSRLKKKYL
jgi:Uma2 family endonuclease